MPIQTLPDLLRLSRQRFPLKTALVYQGTRLTYCELDDASDRLAQTLIARGLGPGAPVAIAASNRPEVVVAWFAVWKAGGVVLDLNPTFPPATLCRVLTRTGTPTLIVDAGQEALLAELQRDRGPLIQVLVAGGELSFTSENVAGLAIEPLSALVEPNASLTGSMGGARRSKTTPLSNDPGVLACVNYTSGSTGLPKGVLLPHRNLVRNAEINVRYFDIHADDRICLALPLFFYMNKVDLLSYLLVGATAVLERGFAYPNGILTVMEREEVTSFSAVPTVFHTLLTQGDLKAHRLPSLRSIRIGAGRTSPKLLHDLSAALPRVRIYLSYGLTEVGLIAVLPPEDVLSKLGSCGRLLAEVPVRVDRSGIVDELDGETGEIVVTCHHAALGYDGDAEEAGKVFRADGIHTGDSTVVI